MLIKFNPLQYFDQLIIEVFKPIADEHNTKFYLCEKEKKSFIYYQAGYKETRVTKHQIIQKQEGWFKKKENTYFSFLITGEEIDFLYKEIKKRKKTILIEKKADSIEFYFKKDKL